MQGLEKDGIFQDYERIGKEQQVFVWVEGCLLKEGGGKRKIFSNAKGKII